MTEHSIALEAARAAGDILCAHFEKVTISQKASHNLLTEADLLSEQAVREIIRNAFPDHSFIGEETAAGNDLSAENLWIVDPLDGTTNYAHGIPHFSVSIAYAHRGEVKAAVVFDPLRRELFHAVKGDGAFLNDKPMNVSTRATVPEALVITGFYYDREETAGPTIDTLKKLFRANIRDMRRTGSAALDCAWVACGRCDAYYEYNLSVWDYAAGMLLVREAGGKCFDRLGNELALGSTGVVAVSRVLAEPVMEIVRWDSAGK
jgi:myo-inositol-1(or 4)-monophosphatase